MYQLVYKYKEPKQSEVFDNFTSELIKAGNKVLKQHNYGMNTKVDVIKFLQVKNLFPFVEHFKNTDLTGCCLNCVDSNKLLIKLSNII